jgi:glycosyltransferase involved in cell wall biosynthesis
MRILYDGEVFRMQSIGGVNRYFENLISRLPTDFKPVLLVPPTSDVSQITHPHLRVYRYGKERLQKLSYRLNQYCVGLEKYYWNQVRSLRSFDVAHPTYYSLITRREMRRYRCPVVVTVWDMIYELFPKELDPTGEGAEEKRKAIMNADGVICISQNTKRDLLRMYSIPESKITVTYLAANLDAGMSHGPEPIPSRPYYLYVGARAAHKNFHTLLKAFARVVSVQSDLSLAVAGGQPFSDEEKRVITELKLDKYIDYYGQISDEHLAKLYRCSVALVYPSLYEGFGIPPLEAMACGTAVVAARSSSIPEVVGDAGIYFEPKATGELADILIDLFINTSLRDKLISEGSARAQEFSWDKTAAQTAQVYRSLAR